MAKKMDWDCAGWATLNDRLCADGRIIRHNAFAEDDGEIVPCVWAHKHDSVDNVLGHALLENRPQGVYCYVAFNNTPKGQVAKEVVQHGDVFSFSIYANGLKQKGGEVYHGKIREVSLVLAGANPGAKIEQVLAHGVDEIIQLPDDEGIIYNDANDIIISHGLSDNGNGDFDQMTKDPKAIFETLTDEQKNVVYFLLSKAKQGKNSTLQHSDEDTDDPKTIFETLTDAQKKVVYYLLSKAKQGKNSSLQHADYGTTQLGDPEEIFESLTEEQKVLFLFLLGKALEQGAQDSGKDETTMKHNVFEDHEVSIRLSPEENAAIFADAQRLGSLRTAMLEHADHGILAHDVVDANGNTVEYGIANIDYLFPDYQNVDKEPPFISRRMGWVNKVINGVHHTSFSRIRSVFADITMDEARAKGYMKGNKKADEVFMLLRRTTDPQTIYKKQKLDRDDIIDITDMDIVSYLKSEMRVMLDEEIARAILIGDGRNAADPDKIHQQHVRAIMLDTDEDLYAMKAIVNPGANDDETSKNIIRAAIVAQDDYEGSGGKIFFAPQSVVTNMLLLEDGFGRPLYNDKKSIANKLMVDDIVPVPVMKGVTDENGNALAGIIVDLSDYNVGADKGGSVHFFDDFDIDYNQNKYLIETRCSGALIKPKSAIVLWIKKSGAATPTYTYTAVENPTGNPKSQGYYEKSGSTYTLTADTTVTSGKTYYTRSAN